MYSQPNHCRHHNAMPSDGRLTPHNTPIKAANRRREADSSPSAYSPEHEGLNPDDTERPISLSTLKKDKEQRGHSPPLPPSPEEHYRPMRRPSASPLPRGKRRRSSSPPRPQSKRLIRYNDLYPSRSRSTSGSSRTIQSSRPGKIYTCDNYGCGGQHSLDHCPLPMRCCGCRSKRHFQSACTEVCVHCGHPGHNVAYCSEFVVGRDGRSRPLELSGYVILLSI